ncbi:MAG TPA: hypothetical protein V6D19_08490 [Stenomitos sp.]
MALETDVKNYVACWMQLGTKLWLHGGQEACQVQQVLEGGRYSQAFEDCWRQATEPTAGDCYLDGAETTIREMLSPSWDVIACGRCNMPVVLPIGALPPIGCPCQALDNWPNTELPPPRPPISSSDHLRSIQGRLKALCNPEPSATET